MTALIVLTATAALAAITIATVMTGGHLRLQEAAGNGWRFMLARREPKELNRHDRSELTARLWVP